MQLMDTYGAPISIIFVVFLEAIAISWIYGKGKKVVSVYFDYNL